MTTEIKDRYSRRNFRGQSSLHQRRLSFLFLFLSVSSTLGDIIPSAERGRCHHDTHTHTRLHNYIYTRTYIQTHEYSTRTQSDVVHPALVPVFLQTRDPVSRPPLVTGPPEDKTYPDLGVDLSSTERHLRQTPLSGLSVHKGLFVSKQQTSSTFSSGRQLRDQSRLLPLTEADVFTA